MGCGQSSPESDIPERLLPQIQFYGRWDVDSPNRCITNWAGSSLRFHTTSGSVAVKFGPLTNSRQNFHNMLWRFGEHSVTKTASVRGAQTMILQGSEGSDSGGEDVFIMLCDYGEARLQVLDIQATDGKPLLDLAVESASTPILFIGDSLTSGFTPSYSGLILPHGSYQSFGSIAVRTLRALTVDARLEMVAKPGVCLSSTESVPGMEDIFWDGIFGQGSWEHRSRDTPRDIFICIGTNDFAFGIPEDLFLECYKAFLIRLRDSYPEELERIHVISPFGWFDDPSDPNIRKTVYEPEVQEMVIKLAEQWLEAKPDGVRLFHIATEGWIHRDLTCDGLHPTAEGHEAIGTRLIKYMVDLGITGAPPMVQVQYTETIP